MFKWWIIDEFWKKSQMYTASVNDAESDKRSEDDMVWKCSGEIGTCSCMYCIA